MKDKYSVYRFIAYTVEVFILYILQQTPNLLLEFAGKKPNLVLAAFITVLFFEKEKSSIKFAVFAGLLLDSALGSIWGLHAGLLCILVFLVGNIAQNYLQKNIITYTIVLTFCMLVFYHARFLLLYICKGYSDITYFYLNHCLPSMFITWLFSFLFYFINKFFIVKIKSVTE